MSQSILDALLAQYVTPYGGGAQPQMSAVQPPGAPQMSPAQGGPQPMPQQPGAPVPAEQEIAQAMMGVQDNQIMAGATNAPMEALAAMQSGAQPLMDQYKNTQEQRFKGGLMGAGETVFDMIREKQLRPQVNAVRENEARLTREAAVAQADQKYKDAKKIIKARDGKLSEDEVDAMARLYAQGEDLDKLAPDDSLTEYQRQTLDQNKTKHDMEAMRAVIEDSQSMTAEQKDQGLKMFDRVEPVIGSYNAAQNTMQRLLSIKERYGDNPGPAGINAMYDFIKSIDPDSVVREGEVRLTEQGQGYMTRIQHMMDQAYKDQVMPEDFMAQVVNMAQYINEDLQRGYAKKMGTYYNLAKEHEIPHNLVFGGDSLTELARRGAEEEWDIQTAQPITGGDLNQSGKTDDGVPQVGSVAEALKLPAGTKFRDANGVLRIR